MDGFALSDTQKVYGGWLPEKRDNVRYKYNVPTYFGLTTPHPYFSSWNSDTDDVDEIRSRQKLLNKGINVGEMGKNWQEW